jgi:hypothetical protein
MYDERPIRLSIADAQLLVSAVRTMPHLPEPPKKKLMAIAAQLAGQIFETQREREDEA